MCGMSTQQWPNTRITLIERTRAWLDAETTPVDKKRVNSCVLKHPLFWGKSATKNPAKTPRKCSFQRATSVTFSKFRSWRRKKINCTSHRFLKPCFTRFWLMITFITFKSHLVPLLEGLCGSNPCRFEFSVFWVFAVIDQLIRGQRFREVVCCTVWGGGFRHGRLYTRTLSIQFMYQGSCQKLQVRSLWTLSLILCLFLLATAVSAHPRKKGTMTCLFSRILGSHPNLQRHYERSTVPVLPCQWSKQFLSIFGPELIN